MSLRIGQVTWDEDKDLGGFRLVNVGAILFAGGGSAAPAAAPSYPALNIQNFIQIGQQDNSAALIQAAQVAIDNRLRAFTYNGQGWLTELVETAGVVTVLDTTFTLDALGRATQLTEVIRMPDATVKTVTSTFTYAGSTEQITGLSRTVV